MTDTDHNPAVSRERGRPREFDVDEALDKAIPVFTERGYHGTSISDLAQAMDLAQGSIYKAFKNKRNVFLATLRRYRLTRMQQLNLVIGEHGSGLERLRRALGFYVEAAQGRQGRQGCLVVASTIEMSTFDAQTARPIASALEQNESLLADLIHQGQADGSIAAHVDGDAAARMMLCFVQGMRVVGKTGRARADMQATADLALKVLE